MKIKKHPKAKALIFDFNGTLVNNVSEQFKSWVHSCNKYGIDFPYIKFLSLSGYSSSQIAKVIIQDSNIKNVSPEQLCKLKREYYLKQIKYIKVNSSVLEILKKYSKEIPVIIGSISHKETTIQTAKHLGISCYVENIVCEEDISMSLPHPEFFFKCAEKMGVKPEDCQVFEDCEIALESARRAGMYVFDVRNHI